MARTEDAVEAAIPTHGGGASACAIGSADTPAGSASAALVRFAVEAIDVEWSVLYRWRDEEPEPVPIAGHGPVPSPPPDGRTLARIAALPPSEAPRVLCVPVRCHGRTYGLLVMSARADQPLDARARSLAETLVGLAAPALAREAEGEYPAREGLPDALSIVSHELRTPLNALAGYLEMLADPELGSLSDLQQEALAATRRGIGEVRDLVGAMLTLSRLDAGREELSIEEFDLASALDEIVEESGPLVGPGVDLAWECRPRPLLVRSDRLKLKIVVKNLVGNALKFTHRGAVSVHGASVGPTLRVSVRDTGLGIPRGDLPFIFDRFRQGRTAPVRGGGVGLGLHIVQRLVAILGGSVAVETEEGVGTVFEVRIPGAVLTSGVS